MEIRKSGILITENFMKQKTNCFKELIREVKALKEYHNPLPLLDDLHANSIDGDYQFTTSIQTLHFVSRTIENTLKLHKKKSTLYVGFQTLSHFKEYADRYKKLANYAKEIFVVGIGDTKIGHIADNVHIVTKHAHIVKDNWFSIITGGGPHISLIAEELPAPEHQKFDGFYSNSIDITEKAFEIIKNNKIFDNELEYGEQETLF